MLRLRDFDGSDGDHAMFTRAIEAAMAPWASAYWVQRVIDVPSDNYTIDAPLVCEGTDAATAPPALICRGRAKIQYSGEVTDDYLLRLGSGAYPDVGYAGLVLCEGLYLELASKCRGIHVTYATYGSKMSRTTVSHPRQVGLRLDACWGSEFANLHVRGAKGCAIWATDFNTSRLYGVKVSTQDEEWAEDVPGAAVAIAGNGADVSSLCLEGIRTGDKPVVLIDGDSNRYDGLRFEGVYSTGDLVELMPYSRNNTIERILVAPKHAEQRVAVSIGKRGYLNSVSHVFGTGLSEAVVRVPGGYRWDDTVTQCRVQRLDQRAYVPKIVDENGDTPESS